MKTMKNHLPCLAAVLMAFTLAGCTGESISLLGENSETENGNKTITLTEDQVRLYQDGVRAAIPNPESANFVSVKAMELKGQPGLHICGHVKYDDAAATPTEAPFYAELREEEGKPTLHRGQVGEDEAKRAKVDFVCREHKTS